MLQPMIDKKLPNEVLSIIDGNLLLIGSVGSGKSVALKTFASSLIEQNKRVLLVDYFNENREFIDKNNGEHIDLVSVVSKKTFSPLTNLLVSFETLSKNILLSKVVLDTLDTLVENKEFDYIFIDESQLYLTRELSSSLLSLLQNAKKHGVKLFISLQIFQNYPINDEVKDELLEFVPQILLFDGQDAQIQTKDSFHFAKGESLLFHIKKNQHYTYVPFTLNS